MLSTSIILSVIICIFGVFTLSTFIPGIPYFSDYSSITTSFFSGYLLIISLVLFIISLGFFLYKMNTLHSILVIISIITIIGVVIPIYTVFQFSESIKANISLLKNLNIRLNRADPNLEKSILYYESNGEKLFMDVTQAQNIDGLSKPLVLIHGGGFIHGQRGEEPVWTEYFSQRGYTVFDVGYMLANSEIHTYSTAAQNINTALSFISENQKKFNIDITQLTLLGSSAGASLGLQAAYGGTEIFPSLISGNVPKIQKIIALFPATDMASLWEMDTHFIDIYSRDVGKKYVGGGPLEFPNEYDMINIAKLAKNNVPETLIVHGLSDTLIPVSTLQPLKETLEEFNIPHKFIFIPYAIHGFTYFENTLSFQLTRQLVDRFLNIQEK